MPLTFNSVANMQSSMKKYDFDLAQVKKEGFTVSDKHYLLKGYHLISTQLTSVSNTASAISSSPHQDTEVIKSFQNYIEDLRCTVNNGHSHFKKLLKLHEIF